MTDLIQHRRRVLRRIDFWLDHGASPADIAVDEAYAWLDRRLQTSEWGASLGEGRRALREVKELAPEATRVHEWLETRLEIYSQHVAWRAQNDLHREIDWRDFLSVEYTDAIHGPASREIGWGLNPPRVLG